MPLRDYPFKAQGRSLKPILPIEIINPDSGDTYKTHGIRDTGADICVLSADIAKELGHNLEKGKLHEADGVGTDIKAYLHTTTIRMLGFDDIEFHCIENTKIAYVENFDHVILGVKGFLDNFCLKIDYPNSRFSITNSTPDKLRVPTP